MRMIPNVISSIGKLIFPFVRTLCGTWDSGGGVAAHNESNDPREQMSTLVPAVLLLVGVFHQ